MSDLIREEWKDVEGYEGIYRVSNFGRVKSLARYRKNNGGTETFQEERILKQSVNNKGYCIVELCKEAKQKRCSVHRLVANAFIPNLENKEQVNHKDENKRNNFADNLEWCTCKENVNYGTHNKRISITKGQPVKCFKNGVLVGTYHSISEAGRELGVSQQNISKCLQGKYKQTGGYTFEIVKGGGVNAIRSDD